MPINTQPARSCYIIWIENNVGVVPLFTCENARIGQQDRVQTPAAFAEVKVLFSHIVLTPTQLQLFRYSCKQPRLQWHSSLACTSSFDL